MLDGLSPIILFRFFKKTQNFPGEPSTLNSTVNILGGIPIPIYLDENVVGLGQMSENKSISFESEWVGRKFFTKNSENSVSLSYVGGDESSGITILINLFEKIISILNPEVTVGASATKAESQIGYSISYYSPKTIIEEAYLSSYSQDSSSAGSRINLNFTLQKAINNQTPQPYSVKAVDSNVVRFPTATV